MWVAVPRILQAYLLAGSKQITWTTKGLKKTLLSSAIMINTRGSTSNVVAPQSNSRMVVSSVYEYYVVGLTCRRPKQVLKLDPRLQAERLEDSAELHHVRARGVPVDRPVDP
jgi:hypothetical protein